MIVILSEAKDLTLRVIPEGFNARAHARSTFREELDVLLQKCRGSKLWIPAVPTERCQMTERPSAA